MKSNIKIDQEPKKSVRYWKNVYKELKKIRIKSYRERVLTSVEIKRRKDKSFVKKILAEHIKA